MVLYAGHDTKLMKNMQYTRHAYSFIDKCSHYFFMFSIVLAILLSIVFILILLLIFIFR